MCGVCLRCEHTHDTRNNEQVTHPRTHDIHTTTTTYTTPPTHATLRTHSTMHPHNNNNTQQATCIQHTRQQTYEMIPCALPLVVWILAQSRTLHMRLRSVEMRLEELNTHVSQLVFGTTLHILNALHAYRSSPWCVGWYLGKFAVLLCVLNYTMDCAIKTVDSNHDFSCHAHVIAKSCCAPTCLFSIWCVQTQVQLPSSVDTTTSCAKRCEYVLVSWYVRPRTHTAPAVLNRLTAFALNCYGLHVYPRYSHAQCLFFRTVYSGVSPIVKSCVACRDKRSDRS